MRRRAGARFETIMVKTFRLAFTHIGNAVFVAGSKSDASLYKYGPQVENRVFEKPDMNGNTSRLQAWRRECERLNEKYPHLHHWIDTEQPDSEGVYYRGLPGEHKAENSTT